MIKFVFLYICLFIGHLFLYSQISLNEKCPSFEALTIDGKKYNDKELSGKIIVINFWYPRCAPCIKEIPDLNELVTHFKKYRKEILFLAPSVYGAKEYLEKFIIKMDFLYKVIPDGSPLADLFRVTSYPTNIVINKQGIITFIDSGYKENIKEILIEAIEKVLKE